MTIKNNLVHVRNATTDDSAAIFNLAHQLHPAVSVEKSGFDQTFSFILQRKESLCLVAYNDSLVVGYISANIHPVIIQGGYAAYVDEIVVDSRSRGKGIGRKLMEKTEHWAEGKKCRLIGLSTGGASAFYEQLGYESRAGYFKKYL